MSFTPRGSLTRFLVLGVMAAAIAIAPGDVAFASSPTGVPAATSSFYVYG